METPTTWSCLLAALKESGIPQTDCNVNDLKALHFANPKKSLKELAATMPVVNCNYKNQQRIDMDQFRAAVIKLAPHNNPRILFTFLKSKGLESIRNVAPEDRETFLTEFKNQQK